MKKFVLLSFLFCALTTSYAQEKHPQNGSETTITQKTPHGSWTVHKKYNENGQLIAKDSVYTYSWSSINGHPLSQAKMDSLMQKMRQHMQMNFGAIHFPHFSGFMGTPKDSLKGFSYNRNFGANIKAMQQRMRQYIQAIQNRFFDSRATSRKHIPPQSKDYKNSNKHPQKTQIPSTTHRI